MYPEHFCESFGRPVLEDCFLTVSRPGAAKQESYTSPSNLVHGPGIWNDKIFDKINAGRLNDYLKENMENLSAKVFRTYNASYTLQDELNKKPFHPEKDNVDAKVKFYDDCNRKVAILCNHQKAVSKTHEATMEKMKVKTQEKVKKLKELEAWRSKLKSGKD